MVANLPTNVSYGTVTGRFLLAYADGSDLDPNPDGVAAKGTILFTPSPNYVKNTSASPAPVTILPATIECNLDSDGYLLGSDGTRGVRLVATDDADNNPVNWTWRATFRLTDQSDTPTRGIPDFSFELPGSTTVDLTTAMPVPDANGTYYLVGPAGPANSLSVGTVTTGAAGSSAAVVITGTAPSQTISFTIPKGDKGDKGDTGNTGPIGPTGATGINWQGAWSALTDYVNNDAVFYDNASWFASGNPPLGETPSLASSYWYPLALQGATGATGATGPANTLTVGTVTTTDPGEDAEVTITGSSPNQTINFVLPQGLQGPQGIQGPAGNLENLSATAPIMYNSLTSTLSFDPTYVSFIDGGNA